MKHAGKRSACFANAHTGYRKLEEWQGILLYGLKIASLLQSQTSQELGELNKKKERTEGMGLYLI